MTTSAPPIGCDVVNNGNNGDLVLLLLSEDAVSNIIKQSKNGGKSPYVLPLLKFCQRALNAFVTARVNAATLMNIAKAIIL